MPQLTRQESFRLGFLLRCAEEGCDADEIRERVKFADGMFGLPSARDAMNAAYSIGAFPFRATALGMAGGAALGAAGGYGLAKLQNTNVDPEEAKRQELIAAYKLQAELARRRAQQRSYRKPAPSGPKLF